MKKNILGAAALGLALMLGTGIGQTAAKAAAGDVSTAWAVIYEDLEVTGLRWDEGDAAACWDRTSDARYYEVRLYRDDNSLTGVKTTEDRYYEFGKYFTKRGDYYFEVRAVGRNSVKGDWATSPWWYVSTSEAEDIRDDWRDDDHRGTGDVHHGPGVSNQTQYNPNAGYGGSYGGPGTYSGYENYSTVNVPRITTTVGCQWKTDQYGKWYQFADGTYPAGRWLCIDDRYYCFDRNGYVRCGWILSDGKWYYTGEDGALTANIRTPDGYFIGPDGVWIP